MKLLLIKEAYFFLLNATLNCKAQQWGLSTHGDSHSPEHLWNAFLTQKSIWANLTHFQAPLACHEGCQEHLIFLLINKTYNCSITFPYPSPSASHLSCVSWLQFLFMFLKSLAVIGARSCFFGESQLWSSLGSQGKQSWDWWQARNKSQQTRIERAGLETESWNAEVRMEMKGCLGWGGHLDGLFATGRRQFGTKTAGRFLKQKGLKVGLNYLSW